MKIEEEEDFEQDDDFELPDDLTDEPESEIKIPDKNEQGS